MKLKLLLLPFLMSFGILNAQDTIKSLIISEVRIDRADHSYCEITNMGTAPVNLSEFKFGMIGAWTQPYTPDANCWLMLPDKELLPGESYVIAVVYDFVEKAWAKDVAKFGFSRDYNDHLTKPEMWKLADLQMHAAEPNGDETDSVSPNYQTMVVWGGRDCWYLEHHFPKADTANAPMDSAVVDQFGGVWDEPGGTNFDKAYDVAGVTGATGNCTLMRKYSIKKGNIEFDDARGLDIDESEWIPVPRQNTGGDYEPWRALYWTVGNHGDFNLDETTLTSSTVDINWTDSTLLVPWGVRGDDSIMMQFEKNPGLAWHYDYNHDTINKVQSHQDSAYVSVRTGAILTVYACGLNMDKVKFKIQVAEPTDDANIVIPKRVKTSEGFYDDGNRIPYFVTDKVPGIDTITIRSPKSYYYTNMPLAARTDTLLKYLEKAPKASWKFVWVDGNPRTDVITGDKLEVTAEDGVSVKEYYIKVNPYRKERNAYLSTITWPDIFDVDIMSTYGWIGDTIPNFASGKYDYKVKLPYDVVGIPALLAKNQDVNAKVSVKRALNLNGAVTDRTSTFTSTAEDGTTVLTYKVELVKEKEPIDLQPWYGEPFISEYCFQDQWANYFMEICNPGNQPLDLSNYMFVGDWQGTDPAAAISDYLGATGNDWKGRFAKYIPGYKWAPDSTTWKVTPAIAIQDLNVNPIVQPGDVFVMGLINATWGSYDYWSDGTWPAEEQCDVIFKHTDKSDTSNVWNEYVGETCLPGWYTNQFYIFKILNDTIKTDYGNGLHPANDPKDFQLIETWGAGSTPWEWKVNGPTQMGQTATCIRKPEYVYPKPGYGESWSEDPDTSEWLYYNDAYWHAHNVWWPEDILFDALDIGAHFMNEVSTFKSTVSSVTYKVSSGYSLHEEIRGVVTGTSVTNFVQKIILEDPGQTLTLKSSSTGDILTDDDVLMNGDTLIVLSTDKSNTSKYILNFEELDHDAVLTSTEYTITVNGNTGAVSGMEYGTALKTVVENVTVPALATMTIVDEGDAWVPLKKVNFDTNSVDVQVTDEIFFEVVAEDGVTKIVYQLKPTAVVSDAFVTSDVFMVYQNLLLIDLIPQGTSVQAFLANLVPVTGATLKLVNKIGQERTFGTISKDDRLFVTAQDGVTVNVYYLKMLEAYEGETVDYLAYVTSSVYAVDQYNLTIADVTITEATSVTSFLANLVPSEGATIKVVDALGVENTGPDVNDGDRLLVTAANLAFAYYDIVVNTVSINELSNLPIHIYPNPSSGKITVSGLEPGTRIRIYNILGVGLRDIVSAQSEEIISLEGQPEGVYFVVVSNSDSVVGRYKLIIK